MGKSRGEKERGVENGDKWLIIKHSDVRHDHTTLLNILKGKVKN